MVCGPEPTFAKDKSLFLTLDPSGVYQEPSGMLALADDVLRGCSCRRSLVLDDQNHIQYRENTVLRSFLLLLIRGETTNMLDFNNEIKPFFQVIILQIDQKFDLSTFVTSIKLAVNSRNQSAEKHYFVFNHHDVQSDHAIIHLIHKSYPTWFKNRSSISNGATLQVNEDLENDLVILYSSGGYLYVYSSCDGVDAIVSEAIESLSTSNGWAFRKLSRETMGRILHQLEIEMRTLGLVNIFNPGGSAPEAKAYFGRDTALSLTPSFDSGYGFSYCLGAIKDKANTRRPFGCSISKSKIWGTWVEDVDDFINKCNEIQKWIAGKKVKKGSKLEILVSPVSKCALEKSSPIEFYLDYYVQDKGMLCMEYQKETSYDWYCFLSTQKKDTIVFELHNGTGRKEVEILFAYKKSDEEYLFDYKNPKEKIKVAFSDDEGELSGSKDLVTFLNKQQFFTVIHNNGYAYRNSECYLDNRLLVPFVNHATDIKWDDVDIRKEDKPCADPAKKYNILQKVGLHLAGLNHITYINDNGANEVGDCLFIANDRIILIHAKFSKSKDAGLRVDDLQVVVSQAVKNLRFFGYQPYTETVCQRLFKNCSNKAAFKDFDTFKEQILEKLQDYRVRRECWIVQPGISQDKLKKQTKNKIHSLLNFADSVFKMNQIEFRLICNN